MAFAHGGVVITVATPSPGVFDNNQRINTYHSIHTHTNIIQPRVVELNVALADTSYRDAVAPCCYPVLGT